MLKSVIETVRTQSVEKGEQNNASVDIDKVNTLLSFMVTEYQQLYMENQRLKLNRAEMEQRMRHKDTLISSLLSRLENRNEGDRKDKKSSNESVGAKFLFLMNSQSSGELVSLQQEALLSKNKLVKPYDLACNIESAKSLETRVKDSPNSIASINSWG